MPLAEIMQGIEQYRFSSELNLAAGTKAFRRGLREHDLFRRLAELATDAQARAAVAKRVEELSGTEIDASYENRFDAALSAYLTVLGDVAEPEVLGKAAEAVTKTPNTWWAVGISHELLMRAIARGWVRAQEAPYADIAAYFPGTPWREALRDKVQASITHTTVSASTENMHKILRALHDAEMHAQIPQASNVIVMPLPTEEGERVVWNTRGRRRTARHKEARGSGSVQSRSREFARA